MREHEDCPVATDRHTHEPKPREVDALSPEELEEEIAELCAHIDAATYRLLRAIGELDRREAWAVGFQSVAHWLSWRVGIDLATAREKVRVARGLERLPLISDAFRRGRMSYSKVRAMTRIATPENEGYLLYIAENGTTEHVERLVRSYRRSSRTEDLEEAGRQRQERYLEMYPDDDGMMIIRGRLPREVAALVEKALEAAMDALSEEAKTGEQKGAPTAAPGSRGHAAAGIRERAGSVGPSDASAGSLSLVTFSADVNIPQHHIDLHLPRGLAGRQGRPAAKGEDVSAETSAPTGIGGEAGVPDSESAVALSHVSAETWRREDFAQRRVDALGLLAEAALGQGLGRTERGEPYQVMIHVDSAVLADRSDDGLCELENGSGVSAETCRRLACDAPHVAVMQSAEGDLLHIGRKARKISTPLWRALVTRDRTCRFPGCARTRHLQAHHIDHWAKGGETKPGNLILLCRAHHWAVHEGGLQVEGRAPYRVVFRRPDGSVLPSCPVRPGVYGEAGETLKRLNEKHGLDLTADTVDSFWDGEAVDYHMALDGLLGFEEEDPKDGS